MVSVITLGAASKFCCADGCDLLRSGGCELKSLHLVRHRRVPAQINTACRTDAEITLPGLIFFAMDNTVTVSLNRLYQIVRTSFWLIPVILTAVGLIAAYITIRVDQSKFGKWLLEQLPGHDQMTVDGARQVVATVAGSTISVASVVFSLTFVALTLMSQQFGPRIVLVFMNDRLTKFVIGAFAGTFLYALIILGAVGTGQGEQAFSLHQNVPWHYGLGASNLFIPKLSVYLVSLLGIVSFVLIIFFVHHMAMTIQADAVVARLGNELDRAIKHTLLRRENEESADGDEDGESWRDELKELEDNGREITAERSGYVQVIDFDHLVKIATEHNAQIHLTCRPGHFLVEDRPIAHATNPKKDDEEFVEGVRDAVQLGERRTQAQSAEYEISALVEVALRALSPGVNDPFTAIACLDHLTDSLAILLQGETRPTVIRDQNDNIRLYRHPQTFQHFIDTGFHPIRKNARNNIQTLHSMARSLEVLAAIAKRQSHRDILKTHVEALKLDLTRETKNKHDADYVLDIVKRAEKRLKEKQS